MRRITLGIVAGMSIASIASAADLPRKAPVTAPIPPPVFSWTGFYVGGHVGALWTRAVSGFLSRAILGYRGWRCEGQRGATGAYNCQR